MNTNSLATPPQRSLPRWVLILLIAASLGLLLYTTLRALWVPLTFDEVWSLNSYVSAPWADIVTFKTVGANNHLVNTLLTKLCWLVSDSPLSLRIPNLLAHLLYLIYTVALARRLRQGVWVLLAFFMLNFHPFLLDFFSLSRGYGLAMAMVMGALYHLYAFRENAFSRHMIWNVIFASLSVLCNLSFLHFYLADAVVLLLLVYSHARAWHGALRDALLMVLKRLTPLVAASLLLFFFLRSPIKALVDAKELYYGGDRGFWSNTVFSLAHAALYKIDYWRHDVQALMLMAMASLMAMFVAFGSEFGESGGRLRASPGMLALLLLLIPAVIGTVQHHQMGSLFLIYRTALFLLPIYALALVWLLRTIAKVPEFRKAVIGISVTLALGLAVHNARALNLTHCAEWITDADTPQMLHDLAQDRALHGSKTDVRIGLSWQLRPVTGYYRKYLKLDWLVQPDREGCMPDRDYYFVLDEGDGCKLSADQLPFGTQQGCTLLKTYPISGTALWRGPIASH
jgi:hypothetical protein